MTLQPMRTAVGFGVFLATWHIIWCILILFGLAQPLLDLIFSLHMITPVYHVEAFALDRAAGLVLLTATIGALSGWLFAIVWNATAKKMK